MNIREVELETGLSRANVRHYEKKGILSPERHDNGYRDYTKEHVETLKRVKLLRQLDISLEDIVQLENDQITLGSVLDERIISAEKEQQKALKQQQICRKMKDEGATYRNLRVDSYLREMDREEGSFDRLYQVMQADQDPPVASSARRVIARYLDGLIYLCLFMWIFRWLWPEGFFAEGTDVGSLGIFLSIILHPILMLIVEPFLLWIFGTTVSKFVLGLKIRNEYGRKLTLKHAFKRTGSVLFYWLIGGMWERNLYRWYDDMNNNAYMEWESTDEVLAVEFNTWHLLGGIAIAVFTMVTLIATCIMTWRAM